MPAERLRIGDWRVDFLAGELRRDGEVVRLDARTLRLLGRLAAAPGEVVSVDALLDDVWPDVTVSPDSVYQAVAQLRRQLGDDPKAPRYIANAPRIGYRLVAAVTPDAQAPARKAPRPAILAAALGAVAVLAGGAWLYGRPAPSPAPAQAAPAIAVMPFLDLTDDMDQEPFADGMTEELTDQLSRAGLRVAAPRAAAAVRRAPPAEIARRLGVGYVLDGSVRKSGDRVRVAARLVRAGDGFVAWSQSYDRPAADLLWVQEDIAGEVAKALGSGLASSATP